MFYFLSTHHASNGAGRKQGYSSKIIHASSVLLGDPSHIGANSLSWAQTFALGQNNY